MTQGLILDYLDFHPAVAPELRLAAHGAVIGRPSFPSRHDEIDHETSRGRRRSRSALSHAVSAW